MSSMLTALGTWAVRARFVVLAIWLAVLALVGAGAVVFNQGTDAPITIPGTESQQAIDTLSRTFPEVSGTSGTIIVVAPEGESIESPAYERALIDAADELEELDTVVAVSHPFAETAATGLSDSGSAALITVQLDTSAMNVAAEVEQGIIAVADELEDALPPGSEVAYGGEMFQTSIPEFTVTEALGVVVAFIVLIFTLGSLIAAGMPLLIAMLGVGISIAGIFTATLFFEMTSITPMLALMLGLAVGIDYTLFIVSRHQQQLRAGMAMRDSIARATATSGSAVVFAGLTVIIALLGLAVAGIPFLTALGVAAAGGVAVAVLIAITLTPAVLAMAGAKVLPKKQRDAVGGGSADAPAAEPRRSLADRVFGGWVRGVTARPLITVLVILVGLGTAALPMLDLRLALPGAEALEADNPARVTYELTGEHFGEGYNGPLILTGSIISSDDPLQLMEQLADEVRQIDGVVDVPLSTPNMNADTGILQIIPTEGPQAESTEALVAELRAHHDEWLERYGVSLAVTGFTAVGIDVSQLLFEALLPFGILVVGLSFVLLAMVFRSVWVPVKATLGYLLSVGAAFGAVVAVFQWGWFGDALSVHHAGPVLSFMPIIVMGVLFGLAMDYEVFLVSRIREAVVHGASSRAAIREGFMGSARVVTAAAIIMFAVFAAFVPAGDPSIKVIALGLAVGVFVDAFIVRMTLTPAVLQLLGDRAWRMPRWLDRVLPAFDVEGEGLTREIEHAHWPPDAPDARIASERLVLPGNLKIDDLRIAEGQALLLDTADRAALALARVVSGRGPITTGTLRVTGLLMPERAASLRSRAAWATPDTLIEALADEPGLLVLDLRDSAGEGGALAAAERSSRVRELLSGHLAMAQRGHRTTPVLVLLGTADAARAVLPADVPLVLAGAPAREELV